MSKRMSFQHESELRALHWDAELIQSDVWDTKNFVWKPNAVFKPGINIPVDLDELIRRVHVAPTAEPWFHDLVKSVLAEYGLNKEVRKSKLAEDPIS